MPIACNTLPTPAEFELLTANQFQSVRDVNADLEELQRTPDPATFNNPDAIALAALGVEWLYRSQRIEDCGEYGSIQHCDNGHPLRTLIHKCQGNFTECCVDEHAKKTLKRLSNVIDFFSEYKGSRYVAMDLAIPIPRERAAIEAVLIKIRNDLRQMQLATFHSKLLEPNWMMCLGFMGSSLIVRVLIEDLDSKGSSTISTDAWRRIWPKWKLSVNVGKHLGFRSAFGHLLKALPLKDPADRMAQEVLFTDMQRFRGSRFKLSIMDPSNTKVVNEIANPPDLCVDTPTHSSPADPNPNQTQAKSAPPCPICGHACDQFSSLMRVRGREMMEYLSKMRGISPPPG